MDAAARELFELLRPAVERAEQLGALQQQLLQQQEVSAEGFLTQIAETVRAAMEERDRLLETRNEVATLREAEVAKGREEAVAIVAAARKEEAEALARVEELQRLRAQREAEHATKMAQAEREREEAEALFLERLHQREEQHEARVAQLQAKGLESVAKRERSFEAACANERARLQTLAVKEEEIQARVAEMRRLVNADGPDSFVKLLVGGRMFQTTIGRLTSFPHSVLARLWQQHRMNDCEGPVQVDGDPTHFQLILNYLRHRKLPIEADMSQLRWLEAEAEEYKLNGEGELAGMCREASERLNKGKVMKLLNGQRNLSGMDMRRFINLSDIDFRGASMYRARADEVNLSDAMLGGHDTDLRQTFFCRANAARADFGGAQLQQANISGATLTQASFAQAMAPQADFSKAELSDVTFSGATLTGASFVEATAPRADFSDTHMPSATFSGATLTKTSFIHAHAVMSDFGKAELSDATFSGANLSDASLVEAAAPRANFSQASLTSVNFSGAMLEGASFNRAVAATADFGKADLQGADLTGANLSGAKFAGALNLRYATFDNLRDAILDGLDLTSVDLRGKDLRGAKFAGALNMHYATFDNLRGAILDGVDLTGVDLRLLR